MQMTSHSSLITTALGLLVGAGMCLGQEQDATKLQQQVELLKKQNATLQRSLMEANLAEKESTAKLEQVRTRLEALGKNLLDGGDDRLIQAAADLQIANESIQTLENAAARMMGTVSNYMKEATSTDAESRIRVETSLRELDAVLGLRQKPRPDVRTGSLQQARVVSLDQESGMLVLNVGESQGAKIGMTFRLVRGQKPYGSAILADVRKGVCGVFIESFDNNAEETTPRLGDIAILQTQALEQ